MSKIILIAAVSKEMFIGRDNALPWTLPEDLKHFKETTKGHTVVMGRKTYESMGMKPLKGRTNVIVSSYEGPLTEKLFVNAEDSTTKQIQCPSLDDAVSAAVALTDDDKDIFIIGGASLFEPALEYAEGIVLSRVDISVEGDVKFPQFSTEVFTLVETKNFPEATIPFKVEVYQR